MNLINYILIKQIVVFGSTIWNILAFVKRMNIDIIISNKIKKSTVGSKKNIASKEVMLNRSCWCWG